jgi:3-oxoacyl-[acyl-carrier protein] reductase
MYLPKLVKFIGYGLDGYGYNNIQRNNKNVLALSIYSKIVLIIDINTLFCVKKQYLTIMNAVITGASKGIGGAIALKLAQNGYNLAICARNEAELNAFKISLQAFNVEVIAMVVDCADKEQVMSFFNSVKKELGSVDVLVNNVGIYTPGNILDEDDEVFEKQQQVNVNAAYYLSKHFGKMMSIANCGHIFNICSVASLQVVDGAGSYSVTKAGMLSLNNVLRKELAHFNVKVTAILPGSTLTASWEGTTIAAEAFVQPEDIANSIYSILNLSSGVNVDELVLTPLKFNN